MFPFGQQRYRALITEFLEGIANRIRIEQEWMNFEESHVPSQVQAELEILNERSHQELQEAETRYTSARSASEEVYQAEIRQATSTYSNESIRKQRTFQVQTEEVEKKYNDESWVISSVLDDTSDNNPKYKLERLRSQVQQTREWLATQQDEVEQKHDQILVLLKRRHQSLGEIPTSEYNSGTMDEAFQGFPGLIELYHSRITRLQKQLFPRLFYGWTGWLLGLTIWGALFAAGVLLLNRDQFGFGSNQETEWWLTLGGIAFSLTGLLLLICYQIAVWKTVGPVQRVLEALADIRRCHEVWLGYAMFDLHHAEQEYRNKYAPLVARREQALLRLSEDRNRQLKDLQDKHESDQAALAQTREAAIHTALATYQQNQQAIDRIYQDEKLLLQRQHEERRHQLLNADTSKKNELTAKRQAYRDQIVSGWIETVAQFGGNALEIFSASEVQPTPWDQILEPNWTPPSKRPVGIRLGEYEIDLTRIPDAIPTDENLAPPQTEIKLPALLPFPMDSTLMVSAEDEGCQYGLQLLRLGMLRYLTEFPPGQIRFTVIDPTGLGESFAPFMQLTDFDELLMTHRIWTDPSHIEQQLGNLTDHMENVFQKYLKDEFLTIEEFNEQAGEVAEPYRILVVANYPAGFSERATQRLKSILQSGPRCGVHTLISIDRRQSTPSSAQDLPRVVPGSVQLEWDHNRFITRGCGPIPFPLKPDELPSLKTLSELISKAGDLSRRVRRVEVPFQRIAPKPDQFWKADSRRILEVPLGRTGATNLQFLRLGRGTSQHVLVAGKTGSGKSTLLHIIVTNLALRYSPDEVEFFLIDFKKGVEFKTYATHHLPHARVIAIESDREFGVSVLERLDSILKERGERFREQGVQEIAAYRDANPNVSMPRLMLIVDEFQEFFVEDDKYSQTAALLLDRLVRQGRAFGIHVLLGSQTLGGSYSLARTTIGQMAVRIALQCSETDAHLILSEDNTAARLLTRPGEAIYNDANGMLEGNNLFQISWIGDEERDRYLDQVETMTSQLQGPRPDPIVFEGNVPANPQGNALLRSLVQQGAQTPSRSLSPQLPMRLWIGDAVAITGPMSIEFRRWSGSNLLIVGQDQRAAWGILQNALVALTAGAGRPEDAGSRFHLFSDPSPDSDSAWGNLREILPWNLEPIGPDDAGERLAEIREEVKRREQAKTPSPPIFLIIDDLSHFRTLRKSGDEFGFGEFGKAKESSPDKDFAEILRDGPAWGVHTLVWCDTSNNVERWFNRGTMREFEMRIVFQMSGNDSSQLIDSPDAAKLGPNRAILYSDERGTREKFRPYGPVSAEWLNWLAQQWTREYVDSAKSSP